MLNRNIASEVPNRTHSFELPYKEARLRPEIKPLRVPKAGDGNPGEQRVARPAPDRSRPSLAFTPLIFRAWQNLSDIADRRLVPAHQTLCEQDDALNSVVVIESGMVKLVHLEPDGSEYIAGLRSDGWMIDVASAVLRTSTPFTAVTVTPCEVSSVPLEAFREQLLGTPETLRDLLVLVCNEIQCEREQQVEIRGRSAQSRLNRFLEELSRLADCHSVFGQLPLKQSEIAQLLSITPEHLSRLMHGCCRPAGVAELRPRKTPRPSAKAPVSPMKLRASAS
jgi:CRP-like cAMP-binding protein